MLKPCYLGAQDLAEQPAGAQDFAPHFDGAHAPHLPFLAFFAFLTLCALQGFAEHP
jgi:hypothetical protein